MTLYFSSSGVSLGIRKTLNWIKAKYGNVAVYATSSGVSDVVADPGQYQREVIDEVLKGLF